QQRVDARVRLLAAATEQTEDIILITRADGAIEQANAAAVAALGCSRDELTSKTLYEVVEWGFEDTIDSIGAEVRRNGVWRGTLVHRRKNGTTFPAANTVVALRSDDGHVTHFVGVGRDITQELELRDQLVTTERMSAVGELIAGVAHEINNPLQTIIGSVELLMDERTGADRRDLELVRHEAARAGQIVRNLLAFVRHGAPDRAPVDLNQIVRATAAVREHHLRQVNIALELYLNPEPLTVLVNREEIQQVVFNLLLNAEHAIGDESGAIRIRTEAGEGVQHMTLTDTGPGVKPELRGRIFEPFFTTKQVGQGTGLGLSISLGIARSHGGILELVPSEPSGPRSAPSDLRPTGACFRLTLPAHSEARAAAAQGGGPHAEPARAAARPAAPAEAGAVIAEPQRRALVVDDEAPIRVLLGRLLTRRGFAVVQAGSLADARTAAGQHRFDLVLCDVRLGDGNGATFLTYLCEQHSDPDRRFVFITGDASAIEDQADLRSAAVLPKPFTSADLDAVLATVNVGA
ncbi:MAG TPA: ATP-binding protein, partial [Vicinamibacterales bacterium]